MKTFQSVLKKPLDRSSFMPLYLQLARQISKGIIDGALQAGEKIPSENDISRELNVSRMTVRLAMDELLDKGYIYREQGKGTYIAEPRMQGVRGFSSFTEDMQSRGLHTTSQVLKVETVKASKEDQFALKVSDAATVVKIRRLRFVENTPWIIQQTVLSSLPVPGLEKEDLTGSLFNILREKFQIYPAWTEAKVHARVAKAEEAALLEIPSGEAVLVVDGITFTDTFDIIESVKTIYRGDKVSLYMGRQRFGLPL